ncbi:MAG: hypothetical protein K0R40_4404 [Burkholderiales bacterium]|nr:hypothetical protein [Burkholderiales bacterium]
MARDEARRPARGADDARHALERLRVLGEERQVGGAAGDRLDEVDAARERRFPVGRRGRRARERRDQAVEAPLRVRRQQVVALARAQRLQARVGGPGLVRALALGEGVLEMASDGGTMPIQFLDE